MPHIGVRNRTEETRTLTHDGRSVDIGGGECRILDSEQFPSEFVSSRVLVNHPSEINKATGERVWTSPPTGQRLFDVISLEEAMKAGARPDEDPRVIAAREAAMAKAKERAQLIEEVKASLVESGWEPPKQEKRTKGDK